MGIRPVKRILRPAAVRSRHYLTKDLQGRASIETNHLVHVSHQIESRLRHAVEAHASAIVHEIKRDIQALAAEMVLQMQADSEFLRRDLELNTSKVLRHLESNDVASSATKDVIAASIQPQLDRIEAYAAMSSRRSAVAIGTDVVLINSMSGYVLCSSHDVEAVAGLIDSGDLERGTRLLIERLLSAGDTFVDVGANIGLHSLAAARVVGPSGRVVAIEPFAPTAKLLARSLSMNGYSDFAKVFEVAASDSAESASLYLGPMSGHHSLIALSEDSEEVSVQMRRLDDLLPAPETAALIKIDVEGAELAVLRGAKALIGRSPEVALIAEFGPTHLGRSGASTTTWLEAFSDLGFCWKRIEPMTGTLEVVTIEDLECSPSSNLLFARVGAPLWDHLANV